MTRLELFSRPRRFNFTIVAKKSTNCHFQTTLFFADRQVDLQFNLRRMTADDRVR